MYRVVLVDDEPWALAGLEGILDWEELGFEICGKYSSAFDALQAMEQSNPDLVITDIRMPQMDGASLILALKHKKPDLECVIVSAYSDFEVARKAISYQAAGYILKPLEKEEVLDVLAQVKARLDSKKTAPLYIDMEDGETVNRAVRDLKRMTQGEYCCIILSRKNSADKNGFTGAGAPGLMYTKITIRGIEGSGYFCSCVKKQLPVLGGDDIVRSLWHDSCSDFPVMLQEVLAARDGGFSYAEHPLVSAIQFFIGGHYNTYFSLENLAEQFFISVSYLCELFKKHTGEGVINFTKKVRACNARRLLDTTGYSIKEVAQMVGFNDYSYFGRCFRQCFGISPGAYRRGDP
jgi:two-component system response regulator YesN